MVNFCAVCGCCTGTDIVREHLEDTLRMCDVSAMGLFSFAFDSQLSFTLINFELVQILMRDFATCAIISCQLSSTLMQLLFSFDGRCKKVEKTLLQTLNSHSRLTGALSLGEARTRVQN
jgi:hypothetical protein